MQRRQLFFRSALVLSLLVCTVLSFQNCTNQRLEYVEKSELYMLPQLKFSASICNDIRFFNQNSSKFVFIVDMSASNVGDWFYETVGTSKYYYWDPTKATDPQGSRFEAIRYFLDNCGGQAGSQFSVIGFGNTAGILDSSSSPALACNNVSFTTPTAAKAQLDYLKARQDQDDDWYLQWSRAQNKYLTTATPNSLILGVTSYSSAIKCAETLLINDLTSATSAPADNYFVFFISDGIPQDKNGTGCALSSMTTAEKEACYLASVNNSMTMVRTAAITKAKNLRFTGVYYGLDTAIPKVLDTIAKEGGTSGAVALGSFSGEQTALCSLFVSQSALEYKPESFIAVNLTVSRRGGQIVADSDMDGVDDAAEEAEGTDPQNPRSSGVPGVLDGICHRLGGKVACDEKRTKTTCDPNQFNSMGLSDCDYRMLGLQFQNAGSWGVDTDRDGMLDLIEIIKGTNPAVADMVGDPDGDGIVNRDEIVRGSDPFTPDAFLPEYLLSLYKMNYVQAAKDAVCPMGYWKLEADRLVSVDTQPVQNFNGPSAFLNHTRNEHKIVVFYRSVAQNSSSSMNEYYSASLNVLFEKRQGREYATPSTEELKAADFQMIGEVSP